MAASPAAFIPGFLVTPKRSENRCDRMALILTTTSRHYRDGAVVDPNFSREDHHGDFVSAG